MTISIESAINWNSHMPLAWVQYNWSTTILHLRYSFWKDITGPHGFHRQNQTISSLSGARPKDHWINITQCKMIRTGIHLTTTSNALCSGLYGRIDIWLVGACCATTQDQMLSSSKIQTNICALAIPSYPSYFSYQKTVSLLTNGRPPASVPVSHSSTRHRRPY